MPGRTPGRAPVPSPRVPVPSSRSKQQAIDSILRAKESPLKKPRLDPDAFAESGHGTARGGGAGAATAPSSAFTSFVKNFPGDILPALSGRGGTISGSKDGHFSWATHRGRLHVWENKSRNVLHSGIDLPDGDEADHPASLVCASSLATGKTALVVVSPNGVVWFFDDIHHIDYHHTQLGLYGRETVVDMDTVCFGEEEHFVCCTSLGRLFRIVKPLGAPRIHHICLSTSETVSDGALPNEDDGTASSFAVGGLLSKVAGWVTWGGGASGGTARNADSVAVRQADLIDAHRQSFVRAMGNGVVVHLHTERNTVYLSQWKLANSYDAPAEGCRRDVTSQVLDGNTVDGSGGAPLQFSVLGVSALDNVAGQVSRERRLYIFVARRVEINAVRYEVQEHALNPMGAEEACERRRFHDVLTSQEFSEAASAVTFACRVGTHRTVPTSLVVAQFDGVPDEPLQALEITWPSGDETTSSRMLEAPRVPFRSFLALTQYQRHEDGTQSAMVYSAERNFAMFALMTAEPVPDRTLPGRPAFSQLGTTAAGIFQTLKPDRAGVGEALRMAILLAKDIKNTSEPAALLMGWVDDNQERMAQDGLGALETLSEVVLERSGRIVEKRVGSGDLWADVEESSWSAAGHKLVRQFLDEKQEEHQALCHLFRRDDNALRRHYPSTCDKVELNGFYLNAAIGLVSYQEGFVTSAHYQDQQRSVVSAAIVAKVASDPVYTSEYLQSRGLVAADIFYSSPLTVLEMLGHMVKILTEDFRQKGIDKTLHFMVEAVQAVDVLATEMHSGIGKDGPNSTKPFTTKVQNDLQGLLEVVKDGVLAAVRKNGAREHAGVDLLKNLTMKLVKMVLRILNDINHETKFQVVVTTIVFPLLAEAGVLGDARKIGETYWHLELLAKVCEEEERVEGRDTGRLRRYMDMPELKAKNFPEFIYKRLLGRGDKARVLSQPDERNDDLMEYLMKHPQLRWIHALKTRRYDNACEALEHTAERREDSIATQQMLLSIATLSLHASNEDPASSVDLSERLNAKLHVVCAQKRLLECAGTFQQITSQELPNLAELQTGKKLPPEMMVDTCCSAIEHVPVASADHVCELAALAIDFTWRANVAGEIEVADRDKLLKKTWLVILKRDVPLVQKLITQRNNSDGIRESKLFEHKICAESVLYQVMHHIRSDRTMHSQCNLDTAMLIAIQEEGRCGMDDERVVRMMAKIMSNARREHH